MEGKAEYEVPTPHIGWRRYRDLIEMELKVEVCEVWQDRPNTAVRVVCIWQNQDFFKAYGFAKVRYPDQWNSDKGVELATAKAVGKIVKKIAQELFGDEKGAR